MDKPVSISVKAWIIRKMSVSSQMQESVIETIVNHQFEGAYIALDTCNSLEFSGFAKLFFNTKKAHKKLEKMESQIREFTRIVNDECVDEIRRKRVDFKLQLTIKTHKYLSDKLHGYNKDIRGVDQQPISSEGVEESNSTGEDREIKDL